MHSSGMRTTCSLPDGGVSLTEDPPGQRSPWTETLLDRDPPDKTPLDRDPQTETPRTETPWTEFLTHTCENITLPQLRCGR